MSRKPSSPHERRPYYFVRRTIFRNANLERLSDELSSTFTIIKPFAKKKNPLGREMGSLLVKADSLHVLFEADRAILYQKETRPFTKKDGDLHDIVFRLYRIQLPFFAREPRITYE